ncbi:MAG: ADP-ribosylation factor-like protein [Promethearchaeota archaeon]
MSNVSTKRSLHPDYDAKIVIIGLQNAGKTTLIKRIKDPKRKIKTRPTMGLNVETLKVDYDSKVVVYDLGGQKEFAKIIWEPHIRSCDGVIFVLDAADRSKMNEAQQWLDKSSTWIRPEACFLFLANKRDLPESMSISELITELGLNRYMLERPRSFSLQPISALHGDGVEDAWDWFSEKVLQQKQTEKIHLQNIFIFTDFGVPLAAAAIGDTEVDSAFFSGFFSALSSFGSQVFSEDKLADIAFGRYRIVFESIEADVLKGKTRAKDQIICACVINKNDPVNRVRYIARKVANWASAFPKKLSDRSLLDYLSRTFADDIPALKPQDSALIRILFAFSQTKCALRLGGLVKLTGLPEEEIQSALERLESEKAIIRKRGGWYVPKSELSSHGIL